MLISLDETIQTDIKIYCQTDREDWAPPLHSHNHYEIQFLLDGEADFDVEGKHYHIVPGSLVFINRLEKHDITVTRYPYTRYCLSLKQDYCMKVIQDSQLLSILFQRPASFVHVLSVEDSWQHRLTAILDELIAETRANTWYTETTISALINLFFVTVFRHKQEYFPLRLRSNMDNVIIELQRYINLHYRQPITLDELAERFYVSKYYLCRHFKEITGYSVKDYILRQRLAHARALLANTNLSIAEVAEKSGYPNLKQFYRIFSAREEISPAAFRKIQRQLRGSPLPRVEA